MIDDLIARLEAATEGSRELSDELLLACGWRVRPPHHCGTFAEDLTCIGCGNRRPPNGGCVLPISSQSWTPKERPEVTTSLDAALPWENIAHVHAPDWHGAKPPGRWQAAHDCGDGCAVYGYGHTEPLARRVAALKAREK